MSPRIDHVMVGARDIEVLRELLWDGYGFGLIQGSVHPDGTQGWLVPFDSPDVQYLELLTPADPAALAGSGFGRDFLERTADGPAFLGWALLSADIEQDAERTRALTGADPGLLRGTSVRADGREFPWAEAAFDAAWTVPSRPFFVEYGNWPARRARVEQDVRSAGHRRPPVEYAGVTVGTARPNLPEWWGGTPLPLTVQPADREGIRAVTVATADGPVQVTLR